MRIGEAYRESVETARRHKHLLIFFAAAHVIFYVFGEWTVAREFPYVMELRDEQLADLRDMAFIKPLTGPLADNLPLKILYTFFFNLIFGAFVSTTLTGVFLFFLPYVIAVWRGFIIGVLFHGIDSSSAHLVFYGTFLLEFGAYTFSSAAGTDMGLAVLFPGRKGTESRREALMRAWIDAKKLYMVVIVLLALGAIWEMSLLHYLAPQGTEAAGIEGVPAGE